MSWKELAEMLGFSYLKLKRWADATSFPKSEEDLNSICNSLSIDKDELFKVPSISDIVFHSLQDLLDAYNDASGDLNTRTRTLFLIFTLVYNRMLQVPNTNMLIKPFAGDASVDVKTEAVFFNPNPFGLVGCHDYVKYYDYKDYLETESYSFKIFNSSVLDSFVK